MNDKVATWGHFRLAAAKTAVAWRTPLMAGKPPCRHSGERDAHGAPVVPQATLLFPLFVVARGAKAPATVRGARNPGSPACPAPPQNGTRASFSRPCAKERYSRRWSKARPKRFGGEERFGAEDDFARKAGRVGADLPICPEHRQATPVPLTPGPQSAWRRDAAPEEIRAGSPE